ncbi:hypothetical protein FPV67DRAFT_1452177 [Lyophyllum atratum]|nr:hypothetical protein FPV67DRAFT_1452177 [Lyophyllum atratum]
MPMGLEPIMHIVALEEDYKWVYPECCQRLGFRGRGREIVEFILRARSYDEKRTWCQKPELLLREPASGPSWQELVPSFIRSYSRAGPTAANLDELREPGSSSGAAIIREDRGFHARVWVISTLLGFRMRPQDPERFCEAAHPLSWFLAVINIGLFSHHYTESEGYGEDLVKYVCAFTFRSRRTRVQEELLPGWSGTPPFVDHL